ncbi:hypothetical protein N7474_010819 [Penicillium riverlandense]|uniref:uncharacterized protein n=1 Tax=Penicillium riverlandense TaxID=1903569 RepID=UPI002548A047|nr:uncharacterized protein N7474_010819 [Penicillium riverlandense]KAJ5804932.1 hypothetical protein N7474_010819 [Penicillium riverlandense]
MEADGVSYSNEESHAEMSSQERLQCLEKVLSYYLGGISLSDDQLRDLAASCPKQPSSVPIPDCGNNRSDPEASPTTSQNMPVAESLLENGPDFSLGAFTKTIESAIAKKFDAPTFESTSLLHGRQKVGSVSFGHMEKQQREIASTSNTGQFIPTSAALVLFPPKDIAQFLVDVFLRYTQTNIYYVEETWVYDFLDICYTHPSSLVSSEDAASICTILMVMACGTQFAHMESFRLNGQVSNESSTTVHFSEDDIGRKFHQAACSLMPYVIIAGSFRSVQACLMMATYNFSLDSAGASYTYLSLALSLALQNEMHHEKSYASTDIIASEVRKRVWWTVYALQKQVSLRYGRPKLLSHVDVDVEKPRDIHELRPIKETSNFDNLLSLLDLTLIHEAIWDEIAALRRSRVPIHSLNLFSIRRQLISWRDRFKMVDAPWALEMNVCRLRNDIHIRLYYWTTCLSLGRPFLLANEQTTKSSGEISDGRPMLGYEVLVQDSINAALEIISLCQLLRDRVGLCRASYATEFTCCRTAMLVLLAQSIAEPSAKVRDGLSRGLELIKLMSISSTLAKSEVHVIEALENAIIRLDSATRLRGQAVCNSNVEEKSKYDMLQSWGLLWQNSLDIDTAEQFLSSGPSPTTNDMNQTAHHKNRSENGSIPGVQHNQHSGFFSIEGSSDIDLESFSLELDQFGQFPDFNLNLGLLNEEYVRENSSLLRPEFK